MNDNETFELLYLLSVCLCMAMGAILIFLDQLWSYERKPLPWKNHPQRWWMGSLFAAFMPGLNVGLGLFGLYLLVFGRTKRRERARNFYNRSFIHDSDSDDSRAPGQARTTRPASLFGGPHSA